MASGCMAVRGFQKRRFMDDVEQERKRQEYEQLLVPFKRPETSINDVKMKKEVTHPEHLLVHNKVLLDTPSAPATHTLREDYLYYDPNKSIGCDACYYVLQDTAKRSLLRYATKKGISIDMQDIEDSIQSSLEYILRKDKRWQETIEKGVNKQGEKIPELALFCRLARSKYKNIIRSYVRRQKIEPIDKIAPDYTQSSKYHRETDETSASIFSQVDFRLDIQSKLTPEQIGLVQARLDGFTLRELAEQKGKHYTSIHETEKRIYKALLSYAEALKS
jgi:DNA-directed RNA polymerase specialized sigma24 family protein